MSVSVAVLDPHDVVVKGLGKLLRSTMEVVSVPIVQQSTNSTAEQVERLLELSSNCLLITEAWIPGINVFDILESFRKERPQQPVMGLIREENPIYVARFAVNKVNHVLHKSRESGTILSTCEAAISGQPAATTGWESDVRRAMARGAGCAVGESTNLSPREFQIAKHLGLGLTNKEIARFLDLSYETIKEHVQKIFRKLKVSDRTQAAVFAVKQGWV